MVYPHTYTYTHIFIFIFVSNTLILCFQILIFVNFKSRTITNKFYIYNIRIKYRKLR